LQAAEREAEEEARRQEAAAPREYAPQEACLFEHPDFNGWRYCTNLRNFHTLPAQFQGQASSLKVPEGYRIVMYEREDKSGQTCYYWGDISRTEGGCDDMVRAMKLEPDPDFPARRAADEQRQREEQAAAEQAEQYRLIEARRRAIAAANAVSGGCYVRLFESDRAVFAGLGGSQEICLSSQMENLTSMFDDDVEMIQILSPHIELIAYRDKNFSGPSIRITCGYWNLEGDVEDEISSVRINVLLEPVACNGAVRQRANANGNMQAVSAPPDLSRWDR
jgi:hypothetical protein